MDDQALFGGVGGKKVKWMTRLCLVECKIWKVEDEGSLGEKRERI